ncbi:MAG: MMPL family transporter [Hyphomicrobiaceae bacterium]|nr:MMPL family transporter [Hyphomicrobiaceae bacterium]
MQGSRPADVQTVWPKSRGERQGKFMEQSAGDNEPGRSFRFSFGLDKLGLIALRAPVVSALIIVALSLLAVVGMMQLKVDDSLSELFRTDTPEFAQYEAIDRLFPSSEYDVLVVVEGKKLLSREGLAAFAATTIDLQLADGVAGLVSMLSARDKPDATGYPPPIVPDALPPDDAAFAELIARLRANDIVKGKFLSDDGELALVVISLDRKVVAEIGAGSVIEAIRTTAAASLAPAGLTSKLTGAPVMQLEIRNAVERDRLVYNGLGFAAGFLVAFLFFKRLSLTLIAVAGPAIAILWTLGVLGGLDYRLNLFINVITPLILVQGFSDSMHLVFAIRRSIIAGVDRIEAARAAVRDVAPACLLTAMNAGIAILSLSLAQSALIRTFGQAALLAVAISYIAVAVVVPTLAALLVRREAEPLARPEDETGGVGALQRMTNAIASFSARHPVVLTLVGILAVGVTGLAYAQLEPRYRLADQVPDREQALAGSAQLDQKLTGANPVHVMIRLPDKAESSGQVPTLYDEQTLRLIAQAHEVLEQKAGLGNVWSLDSLRRWLAEAGDTNVDTLKKYVSILPEHLVRRFIAADERSVLVTARLPDVDASQILPVVDEIDRALMPIRAAHPNHEIAVTGLPAIAARSSATLISELNWGLVGDIFVIFVFLGVALRSVLVGFASILPSLLPIFSTGALLWVFGEGMQFASIIAITVAFSLAIDSTIHFLNRFRLEEDRLGGAPGTHLAALKQTVHHIGPAVVLTTIVLALGLGVTMLSDLPSLRLFGQLSAVCLASSLFAQLVILPASIALYRRVIPRNG